MSVTKQGVQTGFLYIIWFGLFVVGIVFANLIAARGVNRIDLTQDQRYTLADVSQQIAADLPGEVVVEAFFSSNLPPELDQVRRDVADLLSEYAAHSNGNLTYSFTDPGAHEDAGARAESFQLPNFPLQESSEDELSVRYIYAGVVFIYGEGLGECQTDREMCLDDGRSEDACDGDYDQCLQSLDRIETVDQMLPGMNYEYELTKALRTVVSQEGPPVIGVLLGDGGMFDELLDIPFNPQNPMPPEQQEAQRQAELARLRAEYVNQLGQLFDNLYTFEFIDINDGPIPCATDCALEQSCNAEEGVCTCERNSDCSVQQECEEGFCRPSLELAGLFVFGPTTELDDDQLYFLDQYIMAGHPVAFFVSPWYYEELHFDQNMGQQQTVTVPAPNPTTLDELLSDYGIVLNRDAIVDLPNAQITAVRAEGNIGPMRVVEWIPDLDPRLPQLTEISETSVLVPNMDLLAFLPLDRARPLSQGSISLTPSAIELRDRGRLEIEHVLRTSDQSYRFVPEDEDDLSLSSLSGDDLEEFINAYREDAENPEIDLDPGPFTVAVSIEGQIESAFEEREGDNPLHLSATDNGRLFVVANGHWVQALLVNQDPLLSRQVQQMLPGQVRNTIQQYRVASIVLLRNTADWLAQDSELVRIRSRGQPVFLDMTEEINKTFYQFFNIGGVPAIFAFLGLCGFLYRQHRRYKLGLTYQNMGK